MLFLCHYAVLIKVLCCADRCAVLYPECQSCAVLIAVLCAVLQRLKVLKPLGDPVTFCTTLWRPAKGVLFYGPPGKWRDRTQFLDHPCVCQQQVS
jgi:ATP-dependent 26S proteasome regulatory subunit